MKLNKILRKLVAAANKKAPTQLTNNENYNIELLEQRIMYSATQLGGALGAEGIDVDQLENLVADQASVHEMFGQFDSNIDSGQMDQLVGDLLAQDDGGRGTGIAVFSGNSSDFEITQISESRFQVSGPDGVEIINRVDQFQFDDGTFEVVSGRGDAVAPERVDVPGVTESGDRADNRVAGSAGDDVLRGQDGNDVVKGLDGNDRVFGNAGNDRVFGGAGNDFVVGGFGDDFVGGNEGNDRVFGGQGNDELRGGSGQDILEGNEGRDVLFGNDGNDRLQGGDGNDRLVGGAGDDILDGGRGHDVAFFNNSFDTFRFDLVDGNLQVTGTSGTDTVLQNVERLEFTDRLSLIHI